MMKVLWIILSVLLHAGCTTVRTSTKVVPPKGNQVSEELVTFSLKEEVRIDGNIVCHVDPKSARPGCAKIVVHPQPSHLMLTHDDGKYVIVPAGKQMPYYHSDLRTYHWFIVSTTDGKPFGECMVKLEEMGSAERMYTEHCVYGTMSVSVVTKRDVSGRKFLSLDGTIRKDTGATKFVAR